MSDTHLLLELLGRMAGRRVLCIGDVMLDRYVDGQVDRISPEAPIPVLKVEQERLMLGGAGNVVRNLAALGAAVDFVSIVGRDDAGRQVAELLEENAAVTAHLAAEPGRPTTLKTRFVVRGQQMLRADHETTEPLPAEFADKLIAAVRERAGDAGAIILSDYGKGVLTQPVIRAAIEAGIGARIPVVVDPKGRDYGRYRGATLVTPNRRELAEATGMPVGNEGEVEAAARRLIADCGIATVLATRSEEGMTLVGPGGVTHLPAEAREVFDVSGAGDTAIAALGLALAAEADFPLAARLANIAAGIVVGKAGTATVAAEELEDLLLQADASAGADKIAARDVAVRRVAAWREAGLKVGFTNGCFDLLHPGHIALLGFARAACDRLVVGLNEDASVRRLKGETRPIQDEASRAVVLAALATVDLVVPFPEDTPAALIEALRPDVLVKGADYTVEQVVGADFVRAHGGTVVLAPLLAGHSTTNTVKLLRGDGR